MGLLRNNNRWMIGLNIVVAVGVLYSIYKDEFKKSRLSIDTEQQIKKMESRILDSLKLQIVPYRSIFSIDTVIKIKANSSK